MTPAAGADPREEAPRAVLRERARALARVPQPAVAAQDLLEVVEFRLGAEIYAVRASSVREICPLREFTPLPGTPPFVLGIINVRGRIISVVDLTRVFNLPERGLGQLNKVIILRDEQMEFGILADAIVGARGIPTATLQPAPPTVAAAGAECLLGVTEERVILLDAEKILGYPPLIVHQEPE